jgi:Mn-dependent DtxR family transcriptional regulator
MILLTVELVCKEGMVPYARPSEVAKELKVSSVRVEMAELLKQGMLERPHRGMYCLSDRGTKLLYATLSKLPRIDIHKKSDSNSQLK